jgi:hypothetical protein
MHKKIVIVALVSLLLGIGAYMLFVAQPTKPDATQSGNSLEENTTTTIATSSVEVIKKDPIYTAKINEDKGVFIYSDGAIVGSVSNQVIGIPDASFSSVHQIGKTGDQFFVVIHHTDDLGDFGIVSGKNLSYKPLTKNSGIKNIGSGIIFSPKKKYAAFQYVRDNGECKKDLMLGVVDLISGKLFYPDIQRSYETGTGVWQAEMGGYRFDGDEYLQFVDMPRACNGSGDYDAQIYYSWKIETGEVMPMSF